MEYIYIKKDLSYACKNMSCWLILECATTPTLENGQVRGDKKEVFLSCNDGYVLVGPDVMLCQRDGTWPNHATNCTGELILRLQL